MFGWWFRIDRPRGTFLINPGSSFVEQSLINANHSRVFTRGVNNLLSNLHLANIPKPFKESEIYHTSLQLWPIDWRQSKEFLPAIHFFLSILFKYAWSYWYILPELYRVFRITCATPLFWNWDVDEKKKIIIAKT